MIYLIIGAVLLLIIAPIIAVLPSARQKEQMALRRLAMGRGVNVELTSITDPIPKQDKYLSSTGKQLEPILSVAAYRMARQTPQSWRKAPAVNWGIERRAASEGTDVIADMVADMVNKASGEDLPGTWCWEPRKPDDLSAQLAGFITAEIESMPDDVVRVEEVGRVVSVYWHERGAADSLQSIVTFLDGCTQRPGVIVDDNLDDGSVDLNDHS